MKMMYNGTPIKNLNIKHFEVSTNSATVRPSDMQAGVTAFARGQKVVGTGKCFEFANYGNIRTNTQIYVPNEINIIEIASLEYPIKTSITFENMATIDFSTARIIGSVNIDGSDVEIMAKIENNIFTIICRNTIDLQIFYGRDRYWI